mmetsp:Transcript_57148/g.135715  ORF Transcript_57148/g.135715 Transcript_57148/m.135715 type:complete len:257 (+) Transcript_57148:592-1362(+)
MELDVLHLDGLALGVAPPRPLEQQLVVEAKLKLRHPTQVGSHFERPQDFGPQDVPVGPHQNVHRLNDIQEDLVFAVLDSLAPPGHDARDRRRRLCHPCDLVALLHDVLAQNLLIRDLRIPPVHHLVQQLVDHDKVVSDGLLLEFPEVVLEDRDDVVQEQKQRRRVRISLSARHEVQVVVLDVAVRDALVNDQRRARPLLLVEQQGREPLGTRHWDISAVVAADDNLALQVEDEDRGRRHRKRGTSFAALAKDSQPP